MQWKAKHSKVIVAHFKKFNAFDAQDFVENLSKKPEQLFILRYLHFTHFDNLIKAKDADKIKLIEKPENIIFIG